MNSRWVLVVLGACGATSSPAPTVKPTSTAAPSPAVSREQSVTRESAERALGEDAPLDYERPFNGKPVDRRATTKLFHARCAGGDPQACIVESELIGFDASGKYLAAVAANCRTGHLMSCRALPMDDGRAQFPDLPGAMSRSDACSTPNKPPCDARKLRQECTEGFASACFALGENETSAEGDALLARFLELSVEGCRAGIALNCGFAGLSKNERDRIDSAERRCELRRDQCADLFSFYSAAHETTKARDALERACQYGNTSVCLDLGVKYADRELAEPVPGRGQALIDWACQTLAAKRQGKLPRYLADKCDRARD